MTEQTIESIKIQIDELRKEKKKLYQREYMREYMKKKRNV